MENIGNIIATWLGIVLTIAGVIAGYVKLKATVEEVAKKANKAEDSQDDFVILKTKVTELEKRQNEDRAESHEKFDRFFNAQAEMSSCLREVSTVLASFDKQITGRLDRLESKIDSMTIKK